MPTGRRRRRGAGMETSTGDGTADAQPHSGPVPETPAAGPDVEWAICCSGGGIRSASYCLGALQGLQIGGLLGRARLVLGVSGGSYIAASRALVANGLERQQPADRGPGGAAYAPGSPEEQNLRDNTHYLAPSGGILLVGVLSLLVGVVVTFILASAPLFAAAHAWGWLLRSQHVLCPGALPQCHPSGHWAASVASVTWWPWSAAAGVVTFVLFWWWWLTLAPHRRAHRDHGPALAKAVGWAAVVTAVVAPTGSRCTTSTAGAWPVHTRYCARASKMPGRAGRAPRISPGDARFHGAPIQAQARA
jgi:hypothetical protein